jgi:dTMP kinase
MMPDLTIILDLDPEEGMRRASKRRGTSSPDRYEKETLDIQRRRRHAFLDIAQAEPERCLVIDAGQPAEDVAAAIAEAVWNVLGPKLEQAREERS